MLSGAGERVATAVAAFGRLIGLAFQIFDDILDLSGDEQVIGKRPGTDVRDGTVTLPLILALERRPGSARSSRGTRSTTPMSALVLAEVVRAAPSRCARRRVGVH